MVTESPALACCTDRPPLGVMFEQIECLLETLLGRAIGDHLDLRLEEFCQILLPVGEQAGSHSSRLVEPDVAGIAFGQIAVIVQGDLRIGHQLVVFEPKDRRVSPIRKTIPQWNLIRIAHAIGSQFQDGDLRAEAGRNSEEVEQAIAVVAQFLKSRDGIDKVGPEFHWCLLHHYFDQNFALVPDAIGAADTSGKGDWEVAVTFGRDHRQDCRFKGERQDL